MMRDYAVDDYGLVLNSNHMQILASQLCDGYTEQDYYENMPYYFEEVIEALDLTYIDNFTGEATIVEENNPESIGTDYYNDDLIVYLQTQNRETLFDRAYKNIGEVIDEFKSVLAQYLPENFQYEKQFCHIVGSFYG